MSAASVNHQAASYDANTNSVTIGGQTISVTELVGDLLTWRGSLTWGNHNRTGAGGTATNTGQGRGNNNITAVFHRNYDPNRSNDVLLSDPSGDRLIWFERKPGHQLVCLVSVGEKLEPETDDEGNAYVELTLRNAADWLPVEQ